MRSFQKKARKLGDGADWRVMMYRAFAEARGQDPREFYRLALELEPEPEQEPDLEADFEPEPEPEP